MNPIVLVVVIAVIAAVGRVGGLVIESGIAEPSELQMKKGKALVEARMEEYLRQSHVRMIALYSNNNNDIIVYPLFSSPL